MPTSHMQHFDVVSPPLSGRSTPKAHVPNVMPRGQDTGFMHKYHTVSYAFIDCIVFIHTVPNIQT